MMMRFFLLTLAVLIILAMSAYAISLFIKLRKQNRQVLQAQAERLKRVCESIDVIARAMLTEQCNLSEGVLRLKPLLDVLGKKLSQFSAMWSLYQIVEEMPILDARKGLKRNERMRLDLTREAAEVELEPQIKQELEQLLSELEQYKQQS